MKAGRWKSGTWELLKITRLGNVIDGQHRLHAVIKSQTPIIFDVAYDVEETVFDVLDTGKNRSASDVFKIYGSKFNASIPSIIQQYKILSAGGTTSQGASKNIKLTNSELLKEYSSNEEYWITIARKAHVWYTAFAKIIAPSVFGGVYVYLSDKNQAHASKFMNQLSSGIDVENDVILLLRNKLIQDKTSLRTMPPHIKVGLIIKAWNAYRRGKEVKLLRFDPEKESFPMAI